VYVDDMIMSGPGHRREWTRIRKLIKTNEPTQVKRVLGVNFTYTKVDGFKTAVKMDMIKYAEQTVDMYLSIPNAPPLKHKVQQPWYDPSLDDIAAANDGKPIVFGGCAASLLMTALYLARMVRLDLAYTINFLSKFVSKWNSLCDKHISHLFSYIANSKNIALHGIIDSRDFGNLTVEAYPDADLCGSFDTTRSTSGGFLSLTGKNGTYMPLEWFSKRQGATSHSTSESEMIALSKILRECLVPQMGLWKLLMGKTVPGVIYEDNESAIVIAKSGYSPQLRHLAKHHRISLGLVHDFVSHEDIELLHISTDKQKGDILTKGLSKIKHAQMSELIGLYGGIMLICGSVLK
jgi:hypothetical protein